MDRSNTEFPETHGSLLVQLKTKGDSEAWQRFVATYRPVIYRMARKRGLQDADAQDLAQHVLISIAGSIGRWEKQDESIRFRHWLRRVAKNAITNAVTRGPKIKAAGGTSVAIQLNAQPESEGDLDRELALEYRREIFFQAASIVKTEVTHDSWRIFELAVVEGQPIESVASQLNKSVGAAYAARGRVMSRLRHAVEQLEKSE